MNTASLKNFAVRSRNILKIGVGERLLRLGFDLKGNLTVEPPVYLQNGYSFQGKVYDGLDFYESWMQLQSRIAAHGVQEVCEEAAYTWFNRLVAIRILQKNGFIEPVLQYVDPESRIPASLSSARAGRLSLPMNSADREELSRLLANPSATKEQFSILIKAFCESNPVIYNCFGGIEKYISLLLPDNILERGGFIDLLNTADFISDEDYRHSELIGWLYQFYISERKDEVFAAKIKIAQDDIPAATQIFTPNWIVRYMVQNTLGRTWLDNNPDSALRGKMEYLVESGAGDGGVQSVDSSDNARSENPLHLDDLADYKFIDPACGSGHILGEGFELLYAMYMEEFYSPRMAIESIFLRNLIGIDIDTRARQLAAFSLLMKAAQKDSSFLDGRVMPRVLDMPEPFIPEGEDCGDSGNGEAGDEALKQFIAKYLTGGSPEAVKEIFEALLLLREARNLGSIMKFRLSDSTRYALAKMTAEWKSQDFAPEAVTAAIPSMDLILALTDRYTAVVANPPYMGRGNMNSELSAYVTKNYPDGKADLFSVFMIVAENLLVDGGRYGMINMQSWMFLSSFETLRKHILSSLYIENMLHLGPRTFDELSGEVVQNTAFVVTKIAGVTAGGTYYRLVDGRNCCSKKELFVSHLHGNADGQRIWYPDVRQKDFGKIPGSPIGYWVSERMINIFAHEQSMARISRARLGQNTGDNDRFLRLWYEIEYATIGRGLNPDYDGIRFKWIPYTKGGISRRWYSSQETVINWLNNGEEVKQYCVERNHGKHWSRYIQSIDCFYKKGIVFPRIGSGLFYSRMVPEGSIFDVNAPACFKDWILYYQLGLLNSTVAKNLLSILCPTLTFQVGDVSKLPFKLTNGEKLKAINSLVQQNISISKQDWDVHETSWDFRENELIRILKSDMTVHIYVNGENPRDEEEISSVMTDYKRFWESQFRKLHENEEQLNREFISIYGLQDELSPDVPLEEVTILQQGEISISDGQILWNDAVLMKQLLSYIIGCSMGRYRLDRPGLHIAHPNPTAEELSPYEAFGQTFNIDDDGIIPLMSHDTPFEDDNALQRAVDFVTRVFGEEHLTENLNFIERCLGKSMEDYFIKDFWKDHRKTYQNRPIYWLFSSRKGNFRVLVYMHRMNKYTAERIRTKYLLPYMDFLTSRISSEHERGAELTTIERRALSRMEAALDDCREYHERLHSVAEAQIDFDLDDGVAVNYAKFGDALAKLK